MIETQLCSGCNKVKTNKEHPDEPGKALCGECSSSLYYDRLYNGTFVKLIIDTRYVPKWYIEKLKEEIESFKNGAKATVTIK